MRSRSFGVLILSGLVAAGTLGVATASAKPVAPASAPTVPPLATGLVPAGWARPQLGPAGARWSDGVSVDGRMQVLVQQDAGERGPTTGTTTRFGILTAGAPIRTITLTGRFGFDALSRNGRSLFLTENMDAVAPGTYRVRMFDVATGALRPEAVVDRKLDLEALPSPDEEQMYGYAKARTASPVHPKWIFTLYDATGKHPFVHALNTDGTALCIDLPSHNASAESIEMGWKLKVDTKFLRIENTNLGKAWRVPVGARTAVQL